MASLTHHDRVTTDPSEGSTTTFGDDREYNASRQTGTDTGYGDDTSYGSSRTTGGTGYGDGQTYGSSRATGSTGTGTDTGHGGLGYNDRDANIQSTGADANTSSGYGSSSSGGGSNNYDNFRSNAATRDGHTLLSEYPAREEIPDRKGSLTSTPGPFQVPTTDDPQGTSAAVTSSVGSENAPGRAGEIGEKVMGAFGVGGTRVERPKEEQGLGEKIVNLLGG